MSNRPDLVPTSIVDIIIGRQVAVHRKPLDTLRTASRTLAVASSKLREKLIESILELLPSREQIFMRAGLNSLKNEDALLDTKRLLESPHAGLTFDLIGVIGRIASGETDPAVLKLLADQSVLLTPEFGFDGMYRLYFELSVRYRETPVTGEQLAAHIHVVQHYDVTRGRTGGCIQTPDRSLTYYDNKPLMDFVTRHPDKADVIVRHHETYLPEKNGFEQFEADLEKLSALSNAVSDGWL